MARPKSPEKRQAILQSAIHAIAQSGLSASTAAIAKGAGIAEGTLFTYFPTKDDLFNQLYLELKTETYRRINANFPHAARLRDRARHIWTETLLWAFESPHARYTSLQLNLCSIVTQATRDSLVGDRVTIDQTLAEISKRGAFQSLPPGFAASAIYAMQQAVLDTFTTQTSVKQSPAAQAKFKSALIESGFNAFWQMTK
ncbi:MAG TPA: TetR/AcrR family transcriptional regulator [Acidobacteriaceae bacterium]|nr:TetR/AcrR family transcriptional regulator [Acidobacteriaceae bacterium]